MNHIHTNTGRFYNMSDEAHDSYDSNKPLIVVHISWQLHDSYLQPIYYSNATESSLQLFWEKVRMTCKRWRAADSTHGTQLYVHWLNGFAVAAKWKMFS